MNQKFYTKNEFWQKILSLILAILFWGYIHHRENGERIVKEDIEITFSESIKEQYPELRNLKLKTSIIIVGSQRRIQQTLSRDISVNVDDIKDILKNDKNLNILLKKHHFKLPWGITLEKILDSQFTVPLKDTSIFIEPNLQNHKNGEMINGL